jgi:uncharacterized protein with PIN domain
MFFTDLRCPTCNGELFDTELYWLVPIEMEPTEDDEIFRCRQCWMRWTLGQVKETMGEKMNGSNE